MEKISRTNFTRRSFAKRTGAVTLGSVIGLGALPSVTLRLHATDTSTSGGGFSGVQYSLSTNRATKCPPGTPTLTPPAAMPGTGTAPSTGCEEISLDAHTLNDGGTIDIQTIVAIYFSEAENTCVPAVNCVIMKRVIATITSDGSTYVASVSQTENRVYRCYNGTIVQARTSNTVASSTFNKVGSPGTKYGTVPGQPWVLNWEGTPWDQEVGGMDINPMYGGYGGTNPDPVVVPAGAKCGTPIVNVIVNTFDPDETINPEATNANDTDTRDGAGRLNKCASHSVICCTLPES